MKLISSILAFSLTVLGMSACGSTAVNVNTTANTGRNTASTAANTVANAANTVANTISNATSTMTVDGPDDFMRTAAQSGLAEVEMGKLAAQKAADPDVKKFGQMMVDDHGKANAELKALAAKKNFTLPTNVGSHQSDMDELRGLSGADFDKSYVEKMVDAHEADVKAFESQANMSADVEVKAFAAKTLPVLKKHLETIQSINGRINK